MQLNKIFNFSAEESLSIQMLAATKWHVEQKHRLMSHVVGMSVAGAALVDAIREVVAVILVGAQAAANTLLKTRVTLVEKDAGFHARQAGTHIMNIVTALFWGIFSPSRLLTTMKSRGFDVKLGVEHRLLTRCAMAAGVAVAAFAAHSVGLSVFSVSQMLASVPVPQSFTWPWQTKVIAGVVAGLCLPTLAAHGLVWNTTKGPLSGVDLPYREDRAAEVPIGGTTASAIALTINGFCLILSHMANRLPKRLYGKNYEYCKKFSEAFIEASTETVKRNMVALIPFAVISRHKNPSSSDVCLKVSSKKLWRTDGQLEIFLHPAEHLVGPKMKDFLSHMITTRKFEMLDEFFIAYGYLTEYLANPIRDKTLDQMLNALKDKWIDEAQQDPLIARTDVQLDMILHPDKYQVGQKMKDFLIEIITTTNVTELDELLIAYGYLTEYLASSHDQTLDTMLNTLKEKWIAEAQEISPASLQDVKDLMAEQRKNKKLSEHVFVLKIGDRHFKLESSRYPTDNLMLTDMSSTSLPTSYISFPVGPDATSTFLDALAIGTTPVSLPHAGQLLVYKTTSTPAAV